MTVHSINTASPQLTRREFLKLATAGAATTTVLTGCNLSALFPDNRDTEDNSLFYGSCSPDYIVKNLERCVDLATPESLNLDWITESVYLSRISTEGKEHLAQILATSQELLSQQDRVTVFTFKDEVSEGVAEVIATKDDESQPTHYFLFLESWDGSPRTVELTIHELTHMARQFERLGLDYPDQVVWEAEASYYGCLAAVAWCHSSGMPVPESKPVYYSSDMYSIVETLDSTGFTPKVSELYHFYSDAEARYSNAKIIKSAAELVDVIDATIELQEKFPKPDLVEIENLKSQRAEVVDFVENIGLQNADILDRWIDKVWSEEEKSIMSVIDSNFVPKDYYTAKGKISKAAIVKILLKSLGSNSVTIAEDVSALLYRKNLREMTKALVSGNNIAVAV